MVGDVDTLYQEVILRHARSPDNCRRIEGATHTAKGENTLCGDALSVDLQLKDGDVIADVAFEGRGCALMIASASLMTEAVKGIACERAEALAAAFESLCAGNAEIEGGDDVGPTLRVFAGVQAFPARRKCATLPWHTLKAALRGEEEIASPNILPEADGSRPRGARS